MIVAWVVVATAAAECTEAWTQERVNGVLDTLEEAYVALEEARFERTSAELYRGLPCLDQSLDSATLVRTHRAVGLHQYVVGDEPRAISAFRTTHVLAPRSELPRELAPEGTGLRAVWEASRAGVDALSSVPVSRGVLLLDGLPSRERPQTRTVLLQHVDRRDVVTTTTYLFPEDELPAYPRPRATPWLVGAGVAAAGAGGALGLAWSSRVGLDGVDDPADFDRVQRATNAWIVTSGGLGVVAGVAATTGVLRLLSR